MTRERAVYFLILVALCGANSGLLLISFGNYDFNQVKKFTGGNLRHSLVSATEPQSLLAHYTPGPSLNTALGDQVWAAPGAPSASGCFCPSPNHRHLSPGCPGQLLTCVWASALDRLQYNED